LAAKSKGRYSPPPLRQYTRSKKGGAIEKKKDAVKEKGPLV